MRPKLGITLGDINGIGPEILVKALARAEVSACCEAIVYGNREVVESAAARLGRTDVDVRAWRFEDTFEDCPLYTPGALVPRAGAAAMHWLSAAIDDCLAGRIAGIVTCPISKEGIRAAGYDCMGHTDFIAERTGSPDYRMSLFAGPMRAVHVTGHMPLREALERLNAGAIETTVRLADAALKRIGIALPRIAVAGLNPHAGENRLLGDEDLDIVAPAVEHCRLEGIGCSGPYPPDTVFWRMRRGDFDMVVALYHDQGHIPMKLVAMEEGVNVTLGVPIVRTSVDHGTAYDIAGTGVASESSLVEAIKLAAKLAGPA